MKRFSDRRPEALSWEEHFGQSHWKDSEVDEKMAKSALLVIFNAMEGRKVNDFQLKAAIEVTARKAWPQEKTGPTININVLRLEDLEAAKVKAGLAPKLLTASPTKSL